MSQSDNGYYASDTSAEVGGASYNFRIGLRDVGDYDLRARIVHDVGKVDGVVGCHFIDTSSLLVQVGQPRRKQQLRVVAQVIQLLRSRGLHTGVLRGPLASSLQPILNQLEQPPTERRIRWLPRGTR